MLSTSLYPWSKRTVISNHLPIYSKKNYISDVSLVKSGPEQECIYTPMTVVQKWNLDITNAQETGKCVCYITSFPYMEILSLNTDTGIKKTVCYTEEFIVGYIFTLWIACMV